jgi:hypothetical protein
MVTSIDPLALVDLGKWEERDLAAGRSSSGGGGAGRCGARTEQGRGEVQRRQGKEHGRYRGRRRRGWECGGVAALLVLLLRQCMVSRYALSMLDLGGDRGGCGGRIGRGWPGGSIDSIQKAQEIMGTLVLSPTRKMQNKL